MTDPASYVIPMRWCPRCECGTRGDACWYCAAATHAAHPLYGLTRVPCVVDTMLRHPSPSDA